MNILNRIMDAIETLKSSVLCQSDLQLEYPNEKWPQNSFLKH